MADPLLDLVEWLIGLPVLIFHGYSWLIRSGADFVHDLFERYGYWVIFFGTLSENTLLVGLIVIAARGLTVKLAPSRPMPRMPQELIGLGGRGDGRRSAISRYTSANSARKVSGYPSTCPTGYAAAATPGGVITDGSLAITSFGRSR